MLKPLLLSLVIVLTYAKNYPFGKAGFERMHDRSLGFLYYHPDQAKATEIAREASAEGMYNIDDQR